MNLRALVVLRFSFISHARTLGWEGRGYEQRTTMWLDERVFWRDIVFGESTKLGSHPFCSIEVCCGSTKAGLLQGGKGTVASAVALQCVKGTRVSGRENAAKPGTVFLLFFTLFSVDKSVPLRRGYRSIIGPRLTATVKQSLVVVCCWH